MSGCRRGGGFCIGDMCFALRLVYFRLLGGCGGVVRGWGLRGLSLIHYESKFNPLSLSIGHLGSSSHYVILYHFMLEFYINFLS